MTTQKISSVNFQQIRNFEKNIWMNDECDVSPSVLRGRYSFNDLDWLFTGLTLTEASEETEEL